MITDNAINLYIQSLKAILQNKKHCLTEVFKNWKMTPLGFSLFFLGGGGVGGVAQWDAFPRHEFFTPPPLKQMTPIGHPYLKMKFFCTK